MRRRWASSPVGEVTFTPVSRCAGLDPSGQAPPPLESIQMAVVVIALLPIVLVYPFLQRYFTRGVLSGAIKG